MIFRQFLLHFNQYQFVFLCCKDTNPVLKYHVFVQTLKKMFCFLQRNYLNICDFPPIFIAF